MNKILMTIVVLNIRIIFLIFKRHDRIRKNFKMGHADLSASFFSADLGTEVP
jgi:hypothetical protein